MNEDIVNNEDYNIHEQNQEQEKYENFENVQSLGENYSSRQEDDFDFESEWDRLTIEEKLLDNEELFLDAPRKKPTNWWLVMTVVISIYFIFSVFVFNILLMPLQVVGASMYPTLNEKDDEESCDVVYIRKDNEIIHGEIVVMQALNYTGTDSYYIKRVVAVAGDRVQFKRLDNALYADSAGVPCGLYCLYINGELVKEDYINDETQNSDWTMLLRLDIIEPTYYDTIVEQREIIVPDGEVYVLGDNRRVSNDSKYFGCVKVEDIVGSVAIHREYGESLFSAIYNSIKNNYLFN